MIKMISFAMALLRVAPFICIFLSISNANLKKEVRYKQFIMPFVALVYSLIATFTVNKLTLIVIAIFKLIGKYVPFFSIVPWEEWTVLIANYTLASLFLTVKGIALPISSNLWVKRMGEKIKEDGIFYRYDGRLRTRVLKNEWGQLKYLYKWFYWASVCLGCVMLMLFYKFSDWACFQYPVYPVIGIICLGEVVAYLSGLTAREFHQQVLQDDPDEEEPVDFTGLREKYRHLFDKRILHDYFEDRSQNKKDGSEKIIERLLASPVNEEQAYGKYLAREKRYGIPLKEDYILSALNLIRGQSLIFANPFYEDLTQAIYFPFNLSLLRQGKGLILVGRHGIEEDIKEWTSQAFEKITHVPSFWKTEILIDSKQDMEIGILPYKDLYNQRVLDANTDFFKEVTFVLLLEPSAMVSNGQIGLKMLARKMEAPDKQIVYCGCDKNVDGLVDALSHILRTNITEVQATVTSAERTTSIYWKSDGLPMHQKLFKTIVRYLGEGTPIGAIALKHGVKNLTWYSDKRFPGRDIRWIMGQYYDKICRFIGMPLSQENLQNRLQVSNNIWKVPIEDEKFVIVEDEYNNLFEMGRQFASRGTKQAFVNVLSGNYMLRDYMVDCANIFRADPKAIPQISADHARTKRNGILQIIMMMTDKELSEQVIRKELDLIGVNTPVTRENLDDLIGQYYDIKGMHHIVTELPMVDEYDEQAQTIVHCHYYTIKNEVFIAKYASELRNAYYLAEDDVERSNFLGGRLLGHIYQSYIAGQFHTFAGKYYEIVSINRSEGNLDHAVIVRRAADHIQSRLYYRQMRTYTLDSRSFVEGDQAGSAKNINGIQVSNGYMNMSIKTDGYLEMKNYGDLKNALYIGVNNVPERSYQGKQVLKINLPEKENSDSVRLQTTIMLNEIFRTVYPQDYDYITAITDTSKVENLPKGLIFELKGEYDPKAIYILEDSQLDMGLMISVERNLKKFLELICDYCLWGEEYRNRKPEDNKDKPTEGGEGPGIDDIEITDDIGGKKRGIWQRIKDWFKKHFGRKKKKQKPEPEGGGTKPGTDEGTGTKPGTDEGTGTKPGSDEGTGTKPVSDSEKPEDDDSANGKVLMSGSLKVNASVNDKPQMNAADVDNNGTTIDGEDDEVIGTIDESGGVQQSGPVMEEKDFFYLNYGFDEILPVFDLKAVNQFFTDLGFGDNQFTITRKHSDPAKEIEDTFVPNAPGKHYCDFCGRDMTGISYDVLKDGRERCKDCTEQAITTVEQFREIYKKVINDMEVLYGIRINVPVKVEMVNTKKLQKLFGRTFEATPGFDARIVGLAVKDGSGYKLYIENGVPRDSALETTSHELTHIWQYINWDRNHVANGKDRQKHLLYYEGMAEWASIQYLYLIGNIEYAKRMEMITLSRSDEYGVGFALYLRKYGISRGTHLTVDTPFNHIDKPL